MTEVPKKKYKLTRREALTAALKVTDAATAKLLVADICGAGFGELYLQPAEELDVFQTLRFYAALKKVQNGMPVQYALNVAHFYGQDFYVDERVLIPRCETEILAEKAISLQPGRALDICTGSGCIAVAMALYTNARVTASDISLGALQVAKKNARALNADIQFVKSDLFQNIEGRFDVITANPPYVSDAEYETLAKNVKDYEPPLALRAGDGLAFYRRIAKEALPHLNEGGALLLEIGWGQRKEVQKIFSSYETVGWIKDYSDIDRVFIVRRKKHA